ncbi:RHS repeat-associated core domain-containing protein [Frateuria sp. GZRR33]|uniref:RHS repeat-associated core domain-containing protein n=1 Tax=Frateuria sp. GZRR33 TaxID=3351535 RepID=UPI003EDBD3CF
MDSYSSHENPNGAKMQGSERVMEEEQRFVRRRPIYQALIALLSVCVAEGALGATTTTTFTYDAGDHVASVKDPRNLVTSYTYDGVGQLWQQVSPDTGTTRYGYDAYGRRSSMTRAKGVVTNYGYDGLNRVTSATAGGQTQSFSYDSCTNGIGRLCSASDSTGTTSYSYTREGWLAGRGFSINGTTYAVGYGYDAMGRLNAVNYPDGNQVIYTYADGAVAAVTLKVGGTNLPGASSITYLPGNLAMSGWVSSNGLPNTLTYDSDGRLTGISVPNVQSLALGYDQADRISATTNGIDPSQSQNYNYDDQSHLTAAYGVANNESYSYDLGGNRTSQTINGAVSNFTISTTSNRLMGVSGAGAESYVYDPQGNLQTINGVTTFQYNAFNRLSSASGANDYVDPQGERLRKESGGTFSYFAPEGGSLLAENQGGTWIDYVWINGRLTARISGTSVDAIHADQTGRPQVATDAAGTVVWEARNRPFTRTVTTDLVGGLNVGLPGQYYDAERGLWNNGYRDYAAELGRYIESDPSGLRAGVNTYVYANNRPLDQIDPWGLGTFAFGGQASGAFTTLGASAAAQLTISWNSNALGDISQWRVGGMLTLASVSSTGTGISGGGVFTYSSVNCPEALRGTSPYSGGSGGEGLVGGADVSYGDASTYNIFVGVGAKSPIPVEGHTGLGWTAAKSFSLRQIGNAINTLVPDGGI